MSHDAFVTSAIHLGDDLSIEAEVHRGDHGQINYATVRLGGYTEGVNVTLHAWQRDDLRRLADAAARAYHEWTKAEHEAAEVAEVEADNNACRQTDACCCPECMTPAGEVMVSLTEAQAAIDREVGLRSIEARPTDPTGVDAHEAYEGIEA